MARRSKLFAPLALATALATVGLIMFGAVVRVTDSGLGCGNSWPLCNGTIFPPLDNLTAWIEWLHRLFAMLIGLIGIATLAVAIVAYRTNNRGVLWFTVAAAVLFFTQSMIGALVVVLDLPPTFVTLHLGMAMLLFGALVVAATAAIYRPAEAHRRDSVTWIIYIATALSFIIILTGALVRGSGASLACVEWPLCYGALVPAAQGQLALIHMFHRFAVLALGVLLVVVLWYVFRQRQTRAARWMAVTALLLYLAQAAIGAFFVLSLGTPLWGALHVGMAACTWGALVALSVIETMNIQTQVQWQPQSGPAQA